MMPNGGAVAFALNHITCSRQDHEGLARMARQLGLTAVELRNDISGVALADGTPPTQVAAALDIAGQRALSVNALQRFNDWNDERAAEAGSLAAAARAAGATTLVLCPVNVAGYWTDEGERLRALRAALAALKPVLDRHGLTGLVEPLGFKISSLRRKREAIDAIDAVDGAGTYRLLHDTFHHAIARDTDFYPERTGLVHISAVSAPELALDDMRDEHRVLIDEHDRIDNVGQIATLLSGGYTGFFSVECFAKNVQEDPALPEQLRRSIAFIKGRLAPTTSTT